MNDEQKALPSGGVIEWQVGDHSAWAKLPPASVETFAAFSDEQLIEMFLAPACGTIISILRHRLLEAASEKVGEA